MALAKRTFSVPNMNVTNAEAVLKSYCKSKGYEKPVYRIVSRHSTLIDGQVYRFKHYVCRVSVNGFGLAEGDGFSKRIARKKAALFGLQQLQAYELQNFWQVFHTVMPQGLFKDGGGGAAAQSELGRVKLASSTLTIDRQLTFSRTNKSGGVHIEELLPSPTTGIMTPLSVLQFSMQHHMPKGGDETVADKSSTSPRPQSRQRSPSSDSSTSLINAAIEKLRRFSDDGGDDAGWERKEKEVLQKEAKREEPKLFGGGHKSGKKGDEDDDEDKPAFCDEELLKLGEKKHHKKHNDIKEIIESVTKEIETIEETGYDDLGL